MNKNKGQCDLWRHVNDVNDVNFGQVHGLTVTHMYISNCYLSRALRSVLYGYWLHLFILNIDRSFFSRAIPCTMYIWNLWLQRNAIVDVLLYCRVLLQVSPIFNSSVIIGKALRLACMDVCDITYVKNIQHQIAFTSYFVSEALVPVRADYNTVTDIRFDAAIGARKNCCHLSLFSYARLSPLFQLARRSAPPPPAYSSQRRSEDHLC